MTGTKIDWRKRIYNNIGIEQKGGWVPWDRVRCRRDCTDYHTAGEIKKDNLSLSIAQEKGETKHTGAKKLTA